MDGQMEAGPSQEVEMAEGENEQAPQPVPGSSADAQGSAAENQMVNPLAGLLSTRNYLDTTVVPILLEALASLDRDRPRDPIQYLSDYLSRNKYRYAQNEESTD